MKHMKAKLVMAIAMLVVSAVAMTSVSYAWFTVSTAPEISNIEVEMTATENFEIAKATDMDEKPGEPAPGNAGDETKWGQKITSLTGAKLDFPATVVTGGTTLQTISFDAGGRINETLVDATAPETLTNGIGNYTANITQDGTALLSNAKVAAVYGVWLRTNSASSFTFSVNDEALSVKDDEEGAITWAGGTGTTYDKAAIKTVVSVGGAIKNAGDPCTIVPNTATLVLVTVYVDGDACIAQSVAKGINVTGLKVTFSAELDPFATQHAAA